MARLTYKEAQRSAREGLAACGRQVCTPGGEVRDIGSCPGSSRWASAGVVGSA